MKIDVLLSTMNRKSINDNLQLLQKMNINGSSITINQCPKFKKDELVFSKNMNIKNKILSYSEKGLSKSRNRAIKCSNADICVIADDDLVYVNNYEQIILNAYKKYPDADIIAFHVESLNTDRKTSVQKEGRKKFLGSMKIASFQITFKRRSIIDNEILFDEDFGAGSGRFTAGEENIFLFDCLKKKLKIYYIPTQIAVVNHMDSTWFVGYNDVFFETLGAAFYRMSPTFSELFILQYAVRKYYKYGKTLSFLKAYKYMKKGKKRKSFVPFFIGDFKTFNGPAIANKNIKKGVGKRALYSNSSSNLMRLIELLIKSLFSDCLFFCSFSKLDVIGIKIAKFLKKKTFYLMHGRIELENNINKKLNVNLSQMEKYILDNVSYIVCVSKLLSDEISKEGYNHKTEYVFNGIDYSDIVVSEKLNKDSNLIMSTGGLMPIKNNIVVCEAIDLLNKKYNCNLKYLIVGDDFGNLKQLNKYDFVNYINHTSHEKCLRYMKKSNIYVQNSIHETFGLAVIESIVNDCNLLISKNVGSKDIITTLNDEDIIYDPNDINEISKKILRLLTVPNSKRIKGGLVPEETDIVARGHQLLNMIGDKLYE